MAVVDAVTRKLEGALGKRESHEHDSYSEALGGLPEYPHYTRPEQFRGWEVPDVLRSGNHAEVARWRKASSERRGAAQGGSDL
jgi:tRNA (guanine37-N1)-methyltransferase